MAIFIQILTSFLLFSTSWGTVWAFGDYPADYKDKHTRAPSPKPCEEKKLPSEESFFSQFPAQIYKFGPYKNGDFIQEGEILFELEAMKMIMSIRAPFSGIISNLAEKHVGDYVLEGDFLLKLHRKDLPREVSFTGYHARINHLIPCKNGDFIQKGELLFELEVMKMFIIMHAPFSGIISNMMENYVGQILSQKDVLFTLRQKDYEGNQKLSSPQKNTLSKTLKNNSLSPPQNASEILEKNSPESILTKNDHDDSSPPSPTEVASNIPLPSKTSLLFPVLKWMPINFKEKSTTFFLKNQRFSSYGGFFSQSFLNFSFKNILNFGSPPHLNFSEKHSFFKEQEGLLTLFRQEILQQRFFEKKRLKEPVLLKIDALQKELLHLPPHKRSVLKQNSSFQEFILAPQKELLLWNLIALYGILSLGLLLKKTVSPRHFFCFIFFTSKDSFSK